MGRTIVVGAVLWAGLRGFLNNAHPNLVSVPTQRLQTWEGMEKTLRSGRKRKVAEDEASEWVVLLFAA